MSISMLDHALNEYCFGEKVALCTQITAVVINNYFINRL